MSAPFARVLVPYDGSEPSEAALAFGIALARGGATLDIVNVVDEAGVISQATATALVYDPTPLAEGLERGGEALLQAARERARAAGVTVHVRLVHELPAAGIVARAEERHDALIVLGTHGREGLVRALFGSTTETVLRDSNVPLLTVHAGATPPTQALFSSLLVAVDEAGTSQAATALARHLEQTAGSRTQTIAGKSAEDIVAEATRSGADAIVIASHERGAMDRLFGSVAEHVVRNSRVPVFVVRA